MKAIKLSKKYKFDDKEHNEINVDFDKLTGADIIAAETETMMLTQSPTSGVLELSKAYQAVIVAKASGLAVDCIMSLSAKDFSKVTLEASNFLLD